MCVYVFKWQCSGIAREEWDSLHDLGFSKCLKVKGVGNNDPSIILHPPERTSMPGPALGTKERPAFQRHEASRARHLDNQSFKSKLLCQAAKV